MNPAMNKRNELLAQTADREDILYDKGSCQNIGQHRSYISNNRDQSVSERVLEDDLDHRNTLGSRGADIVLTE